MSITDELRAWAKTLTHWWYDPVKDEYTYTTCIMPPSIDAIRLDSSILAIADRIDAEHEESIQREHESAYDAGYAEGMGVANKADMRAEYLRGKNDGYDEGWDAAAKTMTEHMVELPKDADGEYIHVGDVLTDDAEFKSEGKVMRLMLEDEGWMVGFGCGGWTEPSIHEWHHYHAPTVEDVLREFADLVRKERVELATIGEEAIAEYASKLRLAEGEGA